MRRDKDARMSCRGLESGLESGTEGRRSHVVLSATHLIAHDFEMIEQLRTITLLSGSPGDGTRFGFVWPDANTMPSSPVENTLSNTRISCMVNDDDGHHVRGARCMRYFREVVYFCARVGGENVRKHAHGE